MPYCRRLLQTAIFPQKLSRRSAIVIRAPSSLNAWMRTGTPSSAHRRALAIARSSPKLGSVTTTPSISSRCERKRSAHLRASSRLSIAPYVVAEGSSATVRNFSSSSVREHVRAGRLTEMSRKEAPVADDEAEGGRR